MNRTIIGDANTRRNAKVTLEGALVTASSTRYVEEPGVSSIPAGYEMKVNGTGSNSMVVNGATTPVDVYVPASQVGDIFITTLSIVISDNLVSLNQFGGLAALANGCQLFYETARGRFYFPLRFKTNADMIRLSNLIPGTGSKNDAFQLAKAGVAGDDGYIINIDASKFSPLEFGLRLRRASKDKLGIRINDNLTGLTEFNALVTGFVQLSD